ncbi:YbaB/EbfC family nucleoid-associated protein [Actinoplanes sp. NBRC 103695]|uniref:YbaB/EbfC family nucleoid-associated protein n=1 Tax=Actinoplanes sp. NBRC 103695 TaxID=3032202 RepID=UPI0025526D9B|nr:YbaB/EbfC family nucleoid-associated protein [Actinoplanes sp. NBRC 103695]
MSSPLQNRLEQAMAEFEEHKAKVAGFEARIAEATTTVTSKNRAVTVTVNAQGEPTEVKFLTGAYRTMAPAELGTLIVETIRAAQDEARRKAASLFAELLPAGMPVLDMLTGPVDFDATLREITQVFDEAKQPRQGRKDQP